MRAWRCNQTDGVADFIGNVDERRFKVTEGHAAVVSRFGSNALAGFRIGDKHRDAPVCRPVEVVGEAVVGFEEAEHLAVDVVLAAGGEFAARIRGSRSTGRCSRFLTGAWSMS